MEQEPRLPPHPWVTPPPGYENTTIAFLAALLTPMMYEQRGRFFGEHGREPNEDERERLVNGVLNEWARMVEVLRQRFEEGQEYLRRGGQE